MNFRCYYDSMRTPNVNCDICSKPIYRRPSNLKKSKGNAYCSQYCFGKACQKPIPCVICNTLILRSLNKKTCSKECQKINDKRVNRRHSLGRKRVASTKYGTRSFRVKFIEHRGTCCELCDYNVTEMLVIHHIVERSKGGSDDYDNLLLVCSNCHQEIHKGYRTPDGRLTSKVLALTANELAPERA